MKNIEKRLKKESGANNRDNKVVVSWIITHDCQEECAYCISPQKQKEIMDIEEHFNIQKKLIKCGVNKICYIGGEPLLIPHMPELIKNASKAGVYTQLDTNGILLTQNLFDKLKNYITCISLPLESLDENLNINIRNTRNHAQMICSKIDMLEKNSDIDILVTTCVHRENIDKLDEIGFLLNKKRIKKWKLKRFNSASGRGAIPNKDRFKITNIDFFNKLEELQRMYPNLNIDGKIPPKHGTRLLISPQGDLYRMIEEKQANYGNLLTEEINVKRIYIKDGCN